MVNLQERNPQESRKQNSRKDRLRKGIRIGFWARRAIRVLSLIVVLPNPALFGQPAEKSWKDWQGLWPAPSLLEIITLNFIVK